MDSSCRITSLETMFINSFQNGESGFKASLAIIKVLGNHNLVKMLFILDQEWTKYKGEEKVKSYVLKHIKMSVFFHCAWHQEKTFYMDTENELHITRASLQFIQLLNHRSHQWLLFFFWESDSISVFSCDHNTIIWHTSLPHRYTYTCIVPHCLKWVTVLLWK